MIEQVYFFNSVNSSYSCAAGVAPSATCGGVIFVRNVGGYPVTLLNIYMGNLSAGTGVGFTTAVGSTTTPNPNCISNDMAQGTVCFSVWDPTNQIYDDGDVLASSSPLTIQAGQVAEIHFVLPVYDSTPACTVGSPQDCVVVHGGTVYSFTIVTSRGNQFIADAKA